MSPDAAVDLLQRASRSVAVTPYSPDAELAAWYARSAGKIAADPQAMQWPYIQRDIARAESYFALWASNTNSKEN